MHDARRADNLRICSAMDGSELGSSPLGARAIGLARAAVALHMATALRDTEHENRSEALFSPAGGTGERASRPVSYDFLAAWLDAGGDVPPGGRAA
jgi:hypothetical protein